MNKGIVIILITAFAAAALYYLARETEAVPVSANTTASPESTAKIASRVSPPASTPVRTAKQEQKVKVIEPAQQQSQVVTADELYAGDSLFVESEKAKQVLKASGKVRENLQGEVYIEINSQDIMALAVGDTFKLEIPGLDMFYEIEVDQTRQDQFGNQTIEANLPDQDGKYSSIITVNDRSIYGNITTPHGIYAIEGNGQYAWIAETAGLLDGVIQDQIGGDNSAFSDDHNHAPIDTGNGKRSSTH